MRLRCLAFATVALSWVMLCAATAQSDHPESRPKVVTLHVAQDRDIEVVNGPKDSPHVILYLHGVCGNALGFSTWRAAAVKHGTLISVRGDQSCERFPSRSSWSISFEKHNRRISAAIAVASAWREGRDEAKLDGEHPVILGYSQGARRAEQLASVYPERYTRLGLFAGKFKPSPAHLKGASRVLIVVGTQDRRQHLREGKDDLAKAGIEVDYRELPYAHHGEYGPEALRVMAQGLDWLFKNVP